MKLTLIAAVAKNGVIGNENAIPWLYPEDLERFRQLTKGHPVIMGRRTYESIVNLTGGPLPERINIVLTSNPDSVDTFYATRADSLDAIGDGTEVHVATFLDEAVAVARAAGNGVAYVAGGGSIYEQFLQVANRMELTEIHDAYEGDTEFPEYDRSSWVKTSSDDREEFSFVTYRRKQPDK